MVRKDTLCEKMIERERGEEEMEKKMIQNRQDNMFIAVVQS